MSRRAQGAGFTLAEVAVTIVIVGTMLLYLLQGLNGTKLLAAQTRNHKLSRELALQKLGQVGSGVYQEDIDKGLIGSFADEGYPDFTYEVVVGDETFRDQRDSAERGPFDSWNPPNSEEKKKKKNPDEEVIEEPFEKVKIRVTSPKIQEFSNELTLEQWFPWVQVYGEKPESTQTPAAADGSNPAGSGTGTPKTGGGSKP